MKTAWALSNFNFARRSIVCELKLEKVRIRIQCFWSLFDFYCAMPGWTTVRKVQMENRIYHETGILMVTKRRSLESISLALLNLSIK